MAHNGKGNGRGKKWNNPGYPYTIPVDPITGKKGVSDIGVGAGIGAAALGIPYVLWLKKKKKEANEKATREGKKLPYPYTGKKSEKKQGGGVMEKKPTLVGKKDGGIVNTTKFRYIGLKNGKAN